VTSGGGRSGTAAVRGLLKADPAAADPLGRHPTDAHPGVEGKKETEAAAEDEREALGDLQERLFAEGRRAVLLVLQGMDTSGKSGVVKRIGKAFTPLGARITSFREPSEEERGHDFLWRIRRALPAYGQIGIFDRSHYEDVLVVRVHGLVPEDEWRARYGRINGFEEELADFGVTVVKCLLHISYDYQRERLLARLGDPTKRWKFSEGDIEERRHWPAYQEAYADAVRHCSEAAPWYVVPADRKWYRKWAVARILRETLAALDPRYPRREDLDVDALRQRLLQS
jgi:PPK2 family polyphosphate:nucleotide phosphotransferase